MTRIGLTGGIGSGKSVVSTVFSILGYPCYDSDSAMKRLYTTDERLKEDMKKLFGSDIYTADGHLDNRHLATILFNDRNAQEVIGNIAYPRLADDYKRWIASQKASITLFESAILFQAGVSLFIPPTPRGGVASRYCRLASLSGTLSIPPTPKGGVVSRYCRLASLSGTLSIPPTPKGRVASRYCRLASQASGGAWESADLRETLSFDRTIAVIAPEELRIERVRQRSGLSAEEIRSRMNRQMKDCDLASRATDIFVNDGVQPILPQVEQFIQTIHNS